MRIVLFFLFLFSISFSQNIEIEVLKDNPSYNFENIKTNPNFKKNKNPFLKHTKKDYWLKIKVDKKKLLKNKEYVIRVNPRLGINDVTYDKSIKRDFIDDDIIFLDKNNLKDIYLKVNNTQGMISVDINLYEKEVFIYSFFIKILIFGMAYGIIFSAFLYYLAFYIFNKEKSFIYYSLTQLSMLCLILIESEIENLSVLGLLVFSNLFTKEFLNTKKYTPLLDKILTIMIFFYIIDYFFDDIFSDSFPISIFLISYLFAAIIIYNKTKLKPILFYIVAWSIIIFGFIFVDFQFYFFEIFDHSIDLDVFIHLIAPIESLILAFALSYKVKLIEEKRLQNERLLIHQNKLAAMGEMISNIAHQWRQPLTHLSYIFMNINSAFKHQKLDQTYIDKKTKEANNQLEYMSNTIDDFKNFYSPKKTKKQFFIKDAINNSLNIISSVLKENNITLDIQGDDYKIDGYESEFSQIILNLITNAKDALISNNIKNPKIQIKIDKNQIQVIDNGGGINDKIENKIFEPYFTTKQKGTGIGLYMSKVIIQNHFNGEIYHKNIDDGSCFYIQI